MLCSIRCCTPALLLVVWLVISSFNAIRAQESSNPLTLHGGSILAMAGQDCVAVAVDRRFAQGSSLIHVVPRRVQVVGPHQILACTGLEGDIQTLQATVAAEVSGGTTTTTMRSSNGHSKRKNTHIRSTKAVASLVSHLLYKRRNAPYYVEPIIVGLDPVRIEQTVEEDDASGDRERHLEVTGADEGDSSILATESDSTKEHEQKQHKGIQRFYRPYLCSLDCIGARSESCGWCCSGTAALFGAAQAAWRPNLSSKELTQTIAKVFLSATERDTLSGYGVVIYLLTPEGMTEVTVDGRND